MPFVCLFYILPVDVFCFLVCSVVVYLFACWCVFVLVFVLLSFVCLFYILPVDVFSFLVCSVVWLSFICLRVDVFLFWF